MRVKVMSAGISVPPRPGKATSRGLSLAVLTIVILFAGVFLADAAPPLPCSIREGYTLRVRSGPGPNYPLQKNLVAPAEVTVDARNNARTWLRIAGGGSGWAEVGYLVCRGAINDLPIQGAAAAPLTLPARNPVAPAAYNAPGTRPPSALAGWVVEYDMDRERSDYRHFDLAAPVPELCQRACARDQKCWAYVYAEPGLHSERAHCFLKSVAPAGMPRAGYISGVKVMDEWEVGWDRERSDYRDFPIGSADECMNQCLADRACWAIAYAEPGVHGSQAHCWLKSLGPAPVQRTGFVSALKTFGQLTRLQGVSWAAVQACPAGPAYKEDLQDGRAQGWELPAGWRIENPSGSSVLAGRGHQWATLKGNGWQDYEVSLWLTLRRGTIHLNYRTAPGPNRYFVGFQGGGLYLKKQEGDRFTDLASSAVPHTLGELHLVQIVGRGGRIEVFVDGVKELDFTDAEKPIKAGTIALETLDDSYAQVAGIQVCLR